MAVYETYPDQRLVDLIKSDDHQAYTILFKRYNRLLYIHAYKRLKNEQEAQDIVQDIFTILWLKRREIILKTNVAGYLYSAVRNKVFNLILHQKIESEHVNSLQSFLNGYQGNTDFLIREKQLQELIDNEIKSLPPKMREVFELSRKNHLTHKEISAKLGVAESTVTDQIKKALKLLRPKIEFVLFIMMYLK